MTDKRNANDESTRERMEEILKKQGEEITSLRRELAELRRANGPGARAQMLQRRYDAPPLVPPEEIEKVSRRVQEAIDDPKIGLHPINLTYVKPVMEILAATHPRFDKQAELPTVVDIDRTKVGPLVAEPLKNADEALEWNSNRA